MPQGIAERQGRQRRHESFPPRRGDECLRHEEQESRDEITAIERSQHAADGPPIGGPKERGQEHDRRSQLDESLYDRFSRRRHSSLAIVVCRVWFSSARYCDRSVQDWSSES